MHFTPVALSLLAVCASAYRHGGSHRVHTEILTVTVTGENPAYTPAPVMDKHRGGGGYNRQPGYGNGGNVNDNYNGGGGNYQQPQPTTLATRVSSAAPPSGTGGGSAPGGDDQKAALDAHNAARADVGVAALEWDDSLAAEAASYAQTIAGMGSLQHSGVSGQGENLYMQSGSGQPLKAAVDAFVSEKSQYGGQPISGSNFHGFGHYTQVVWKSTTKVGMGLAKASDGSTYVVARYSPPGNMIGSKPY